MSKQITLEKMKSNLDFFKKMYDAVRIIDPVKKQVLDYRGSELAETDKICYDYWENGKICDNCISIRAHYGNASYMKLEQRPDLILMVTALPIENAERPAVLELLKNATDTMMIGNGEYNGGQFMGNIVSTLNDIAMRDPLTQFYNRRFIDDRLPVNIINAILSDMPLSIIFIDVDNLRNLNNTCGHSVGDDALKRAASAINKSIRSDDDWAARYGGDEFIVCLDKTDYDKAHSVAERIRNNVENICVPTKDGDKELTVSLGIYTMKGENLTADEIIDRADKKMYEAKMKGKNSIVGNY